MKKKKKKKKKRNKKTARGMDLRGYASTSTPKAVVQNVSERPPQEPRSKEQLLPVESKKDTIDKVKGKEARKNRYEKESLETVDQQKSGRKQWAADHKKVTMGEDFLAIKPSILLLTYDQEQRHKDILRAQGGLPINARPAHSFEELKLAMDDGDTVEIASRRKLVALGFSWILVLREHAWRRPWKLLCCKLSRSTMCLSHS